MNPTRREVIAATLLAPATGALRPPLARAEENKLTLSTFDAEVTIPLGHPCMGGGIAPAKEVVDPLFAYGFVLQGAGKPVVFLAVDWCEIRNGAYDAFRTAVAKAVGTEPVRVMLCALHQHDAPVMDTDAQQLLEEHRAKGAVCDIAFFEKAVARVASAAKESLKHARPVTHVGTGEAKVEGVASNRRYRDEGGKVRYNRMSATRDPKIRAGEEGTIDPMLKTLSFWNGDTPLVGLSAYAVHPMSYYGRGQVSADFVGMARKRRQADTPGVMQLYASGCSGNVTAGKYNDGDPANRPVLADRMYKAMSAAWKATQKAPVKDVSFRSVPLTLAARTSEGFSEEALLKRLKDDPRPFGQCLAAMGLSWKHRCDAKMPPGAAVKPGSAGDRPRAPAGAAVKPGLAGDRPRATIDVPVLDLGGACVLLLPGESYVEFQLAAQKVRPNDFVLVAGYGECGPGYIPIERAWKENDGNLSDWCWVDPGSEKRMADAIAKALQK
jgi:hypothetical protein